MYKRRGLRTEKLLPERRGAATVEFALCAPVFFLIVFSGIEISRANMLIHTVESALLHGARRGIVPGASAAQCKQAAQEVLDIARVRSSTITVSPSIIDDATTTISIAISVPLDNNGYQASKLFLGKSIERTAQLKRED